MRHHDRDRFVAYLPVAHPFVVIAQNCGAIVGHVSPAGATATVVSIRSSFDRVHESEAEVLYKMSR
jgi:hypothetical protein